MARPARKSRRRVDRRPRAVEQCSIRVGESAAHPVDIHLKESPLAWLRRRRGRNGGPLISETQFAAGEKLRADFTSAQLLPRMTTNWDCSAAIRKQGGAPGMEFSEYALAAKQRVRRAVETVGPELAGVLLDVCCFLKGLELVETERRWPPRTAKIVLSLALDRLAAHYGLGARAVGRARGEIRGWGDEGYRPEFRV